jgi:hypothetical protein
MFRGRGFCCPASPPYLPEVLNSTFPPAHHQRVPQLSRFRARSEQRGRVLLCRDAFVAYCLDSMAKICEIATPLIKWLFKVKSLPSDGSCGIERYKHCFKLRTASGWDLDSRHVPPPSWEGKISRACNGVQAGRVSRLGSNVCLSLTSPLLRIGDPSPYAPSPALPSVDPTVRRSCGVSILRSYPLTRATRYKPKHDPEALVAIGTSLAGAQSVRVVFCQYAPSSRHDSRRKASSSPSTPT